MRTSGSISRSVILGPAALEGPGQDASLRAVAALGDELQSLQLTIGSPATLSDLEEALDNPETRQLTLIARCEGDGLVFADEWASFANLADLASYTSAKDLLHLVTNCGVSAMNAFADTGRFGRVVVSRFSSGDVSSFTQALETVVRLNRSFASASPVTIDEAIDRANEPWFARQPAQDTRNASTGTAGDCPGQV